MAGLGYLNEAQLADIIEDAAAAGAAVVSFNGRSGAISLTSGDVTTALTFSPTSVAGLTGSQTVAAFKTGLSLAKADVGLGSVDNTTDAGKPVSTATQTALNLKAALASPSFTGSVTITGGFTTTGYPLNVSNGGYYHAYFQGTNAANQVSFYIENDRGSFASYGGFMIGGSTSGLGNLFGVQRRDRLFMFADGASNLGMYVGTLSAQPFVIGTSGTQRWQVNSSGHLLAGTDNSYDIGAAGATRPRTAYIGTSVYVGATKVLGAQGAAVADATNATDVITQLNALLAKLRTHGLIAT